MAWVRTYFYPRPPRGGRRCSVFTALRHEQFLSTPSARRATGGDSDVPTHGKISIHALREEGDLVMLGNTLGTLISIHALREEGDVIMEPLRLIGHISIHALREEGDVYGIGTSNIDPVFLSTPSARRAT